MVHGTQCICEICTCGRHQCPSEAAQLHRHQQQQHEGIIGGTEGGGHHFYRKEFATIGNSAERATPTRPKDELSLPQGPFAQRETTAQEAAPHPTDARSTFATSAALRQRAHQSQIGIGDRTATEPSAGGGSGMRSTYREESERALVGANGTTARDSRRAIRAAAENGGQAAALFGTGDQIAPEGTTTTIHRTEFGQKVAEKAQTVRPKTSDLWKRDGKIEGQTVSRTEFGEKARAERASPFRPRENGPLLQRSGDEFQRETSNLRDFGPKKGERSETKRPVDSDLFRSDEPLERQTVNRGDYGQQGKGDRFEAKPHESSDIWRANGGAKAPFGGRGVNAEEYGRGGGGAAMRAERYATVKPKESDILKGQGAFARESHQRAEFGPKRAERAEVKKRTESDIWKHEGPIERISVNRAEYAHVRGERAETVRPTESDILKGQGAFAQESHQRAEFGPKRAERAEVKKRTESDIWKREGRHEMDTVSRTAFKGAGGERAQASRPTESHILRGDGKLAAESVARAAYGQKGRGDRYPAKRHEEAELWRQEGTIGADGTVNRRDYANDGKRGERHEISWAKGREATAPLFDPDLDPSASPAHATTVHRSEFVQRQGAERAQRKVPTEEGADLLRGDGTFMSETSKSADYQPKRGERFDAKRHQPSDIWKHEGPIERTSVNRAEYAHVRGERAETVRPTESDILKGQGAFAQESHQRAEFGLKRAERAEMKKPSDSDVFRQEGTVGELSTVNRTDFVPHGRGDRYERRVPPEESSHILGPSAEEGVTRAPLAASTVSRDEFGEKRAERVQRHRPIAQFRLDEAGGWEGQPLDTYTTVSREDFAEKRADAAAASDGARAAAAAAKHAISDESLVWHSDADMERWAREYGTQTHSMEQFVPKELVDRMVPVPHGTQLSITEPGATFDSSTMYSDHYQVSPDSFTHIERPQQIRPSTALRLSGNLDMVTGYRTEFQNKVKPCPAGELVESLKKDKTHTENFEFHTINKGHRMYKSKENLATLSAGEGEQ